jgi:hypothetical protein
MAEGTAVKTFTTDEESALCFEIHEYLPTTFDKTMLSNFNGQIAAQLVEAGILVAVQGVGRFGTAYKLADEKINLAVQHQTRFDSPQ